MTADSPIQFATARQRQMPTADEIAGRPEGTLAAADAARARLVARAALPPQSPVQALRQRTEDTRREQETALMTLLALGAETAAQFKESAPELTMLSPGVRTEMERAADALAASIGRMTASMRAGR